jgi:Lamin Tail Domain
MRENKKVGLLLLIVINLCLFDVQAQSPIRYSIVIDEIMADPSPTIGLPNNEFIELKNVSVVAWNLFHWKISDGSTTSTISINFLLQPDSFVVICSSSALDAFSAFGPAIGVSNFPSLNNEGDVISLYSPDGKLIHAVGYQLTWFNNAVKSEGGWTLEMTDPLNPCAGRSNWKASADVRGGTPGQKNSVNADNPDQQPPALMRTYSVDSLTIIAVFDEPLDSNEAAVANHYLLDDPNISPIQATVLSPLFKEVQLRFTQKLQAGRIYQLMVSEVKDCSNNIIGMVNKRRAGIPGDADTLDLVINEILFNPREDGVDYVELLNRSKKIIDASGMYIANRNFSGAINPPRKISDSPFLIFPGDYITISESSEKVQQQYIAKNGDWLLVLGALPSFPDDHGSVIILNQMGKNIDELKYDEDWHFPLLHNKEGIALERIDPGKPTQMKENWTSAASDAGYGTPTYENSQFKTGGSQVGTISIEPAIFSPDNDGMDDICFIHYELVEPNYIANLLVFDVQGREIRRLYNNAILSQKGYLRWDGLGEGRKSLPGGIYIIYTEMFNLSGKTKRFKNVVTLAKKF